MTRRCSRRIAGLALCVATLVTGCSPREPIPDDVGIADQKTSTPAAGAPPIPRPRPTTCAEAGRRLVRHADTPPPVVPVVDHSAGQPPPVQPTSVYDFVSSVGINIHASYNNTAYGDHDRVAAALRDLGIVHIRDGLVPDRDRDQYPFLRRLAAEGICANLIIGDSKADTNQIDVVVDDLAQVASAVDLLESSNESDLTIGDNWSARLAAYQPELVERVKRDPAVPDVPLLGPTFGRTNAMRVAATMSLPFDVGALHPYPGGGPPSQHLDENFAAAAFPDDAPVVATEHGYHTALGETAIQPGVPEDVAAVYVPRVFLESYAAGIDRTYLYELVDQSPDPDDDTGASQFGLLRSDFSDKPAAAAVRNLLTILGGRAPVPLDATALRVHVVSDTADVRGLLLQDGGGAWWLALWRQVSVYDVDREARLDVAPADATVVVGQPVDVDVYRPVDGRGVRRHAVAHTHIAVAIPADPLLLSLRTSGVEPSGGEPSR